MLVGGRVRIYEWAEEEAEMTSELYCSGLKLTDNLSVDVGCSGTDESL